MTQILPDIFAIEVPEDAKDFECVHVFHGEDVVYYPDDKGETVPIGNAPCHCDQVEILFTTKDCSEEQAAQLPLGNADNGFGYKDYEGKSSGTFYADHSLQSLLRSHNLTGKNYLLIKKQP